MSEATIPPDAPRGFVLGDASRLQDPARIARNAAELVLLDVVQLPASFDRQGVAERLQHAIGDCYVALDVAPEEPAHVDALHQAIARLSEAREMLLRGQQAAPSGPIVVERPIKILEDACLLLRQRAEHVAELQMDLLVESRRYRLMHGEQEPRRPKAFRASVGLPELHVVNRSPLHPSIPLGEAQASSAPPSPPPIARPKTLDELKALAAAAAESKLDVLDDDEQPPAKAAPPVLLAYQAAVEEHEALRTLARDTLEDIGSLGNLRKPIPGESWLDQAPFEQRLLDNLDYFVSLGPTALPLVTIHHREADPPDRHRAFALAFVFGSIEGRDTVGTIVSCIKRSAPEEWEGFVDALCLAPNPAIDELLPELLVHPKPGVVGLALEVLGKRGSLPDDVIEWVRGRGDRELLRRLVRGLGSCLAEAVAVPFLEEILWSDVDDDSWIEAAKSLLRRGHGATRDRLRDVLRAPASARRRDAAAALLAVVGQPDDGAVLVDVAQTSGNVELVRALGRFGHLETFPFLVGALERGGELAEAAGEALDRITAAGLREIVEEPWDTGAPPELLQQAHENGVPKAMRKVERVVLDPAAWRAWARERLPGLDRRRKHRGGVPFSPVHIVDELEARATPPDRRDEALFELACTLGVRMRLRADDWVERQKAHLAELRALAARAQDVPGAWVFAGAASPTDRWSWDQPEADGWRAR